jgi:hypothetical protein
VPMGRLRGQLVSPGFVPSLPPEPSLRHTPLRNFVPRGQQFGGVPMGRLRGQLMSPPDLLGFAPSSVGPVSRLRHAPSLNRVPRGQHLGQSPTMPVGHRGGSVTTGWHAPLRNRVPVGQQFGGAPTGRLRGQTTSSPDLLGVARPLPGPVLR